MNRTHHSTKGWSLENNASIPLITLQWRLLIDKLKFAFSDLTSVGIVNMLYCSEEVTGPGGTTGSPDIVNMLYCSEEVSGPGGTTGSPDIGVTVALADQLNLADKLR